MSKKISSNNAAVHTPPELPMPEATLGFYGLWQDGGCDYSGLFEKSDRVAFLLLGTRKPDPFILKQFQAVSAIHFGLVHCNLWYRSKDRWHLLEALKHANAAVELLEKNDSDLADEIRAWICHIQDVLMKKGETVKPKERKSK